MKKNILLVIILFVIALTANAQPKDSLIRLINTTNDTKEKAEALITLGKTYLKEKNQQKALDFLQQAVTLCKENKDYRNLQNAYLLIGFAYKNNDLEKSKEAFQKSINIFTLGNDTLVASRAYNGLAQVEMISGNLYNALKYLKKTIELKKAAGDIKGEGIAYNTLGNTYFQLGENDKAIKSYETALTLFQKINFLPGIATVYNAIGVVYDNLANYDNIENFKEAESFYRKAIEVFKQLNDSIEIARTSLNIGIIHTQLLNNAILKEKDRQKVEEEYKSALKYLNQAYEIFDRKNDKASLVKALINLAALNIEKGNYQESINLLNKAFEHLKDLDYPAYSTGNVYYYLANANLLAGNHNKALEYINKSIDISKKANIKKNLAESYRLLSIINDSARNYKAALEALRDYLKLKDEIWNEQTNKLIQQFGIKEKEKELEIKEVRIKQQEAENRAQKLMIYALLIFALLVLVVIFLIFKQYREKKKANEILEAKNKLISEQKQQITDSIMYAKNIQLAVLPPLDNFSEYLNNYFILFKPRDIVSGDFYWIRSSDDGKKLYVAAADCTGHGVPGAFMSMLGISFLNEIISTYPDVQTEKTLDTLREKIINSLHKSAKDGMDISLVKIDKEKGTVSFSGAYNPLYVIRSKDKTPLQADKTMEEGNYVLYEFKADRMPVGYSLKMKDFTSKTFGFEKDDILIMFSDGFADQFGGPSNSKYKYKNFKKLLLKLASLPMDKIKEELDREHENWKGENEQTDDVIVMGIKL